MFINKYCKYNSRCLLRLGHKLTFNQQSKEINTQINSSNLKLLNSHTAITNLIRNMSAKHLYNNRLAKEKSPYLLQHAHNPVDWYPWGEEAINLAHSQNKVIFLSVGYSTCHWCHVMEKESFENEEIAKIMNENFVNIKVDREERPDIDKLYMAFLLLVNGSGGWPMSVFLTPDLTPITAGTYFPPADRWGMPGFSTILNKIAQKWKTDGSEIKLTGVSIIEALRKAMSDKPVMYTEDSREEHHIYATVESKFNQAVNIYIQNYDKIWGGSSGAPKFPEMSKLDFMLHAFVQNQNNDILDVALLQLDKMANGGIHDNVFGGFSRYSVDKRWHVPHFEKMLYDQGQIMAAYANAYKITRYEKYLKIADRIYRYICSELKSSTGGFYSGEDADSLPSADSNEKVEGAYYAWTYNEIKNILDTNSEKFKDFKEQNAFEIYKYHYNIKETGNVEPSSDPHGHLTAKNILFIDGSIEDTSKKFKTTPQIIEKILDTANEALKEVRHQRCHPHLDTKIVCSWNGLILTGLSQLSTIKDAPNKEQYLKTAKDLYEFIKKNLHDPRTGKLYRTYYDDQEEEEATQISSRTYGFLDDYAFLIKGLIDYYVASLDTDVLHFAKQLQDKQNELFWDNINGGYFYTEANAAHVVVRMKEDHDGAEPAGNSISAQNLAMLRLYFENTNYKQQLEKLFQFFAAIKPFGYVLPKMMSALLVKDSGLAMLVVVGENSKETHELFDVGRDHYVPGMIVLSVDPTKPELTVRKTATQFKAVGDKVTAYICEKQACSLPMNKPEMLKENFTKYLLVE